MKILVLQDTEILEFNDATISIVNSCIKYKIPYAIMYSYTEYIRVTITGFNTNLEYHTDILNNPTEVNLKNWFDNQKSLMNLYELTLGS